MVYRWLLRSGTFDDIWIEAVANMKTRCGICELELEDADLNCVCRSRPPV